MQFKLGNFPNEKKRKTLVVFLHKGRAVIFLCQKLDLIPCDFETGHHNIRQLQAW